MINILLVDDHKLVRTGVRKILADERGLKVIGEVENGEEAIKFCRQTEPDIILMDIDMPGIGGLEATKKICRLCPDTKILILTSHCEDPFPTKVMKIGAAGYLTKDAPANEMINAIRSVHCGQRYITPDIAQKMALNKSQSDNPFTVLELRFNCSATSVTFSPRVTITIICSSRSDKSVNGLSI